MGRKSFHCDAGQLCYGSPCGMNVPAAVLGTCRAQPGPGECWGDEDCPRAQICSGAQVCECGMACLVADTPGTCQQP